MVDGQAVKLQFTIVLFFLLRGSSRAAQNRLDTRHQFLGVKGFDHIVVRAEFQSEYFIECFAFRGKHDDGDIACRAQFAADLPPVFDRKHNVQQDQIGLFFLEHVNRALPVIGHNRLIPFFFHIQANQFTNIGFVVYNQDFTVKHLNDTSVPRAEAADGKTPYNHRRILRSSRQTDFLTFIHQLIRYFFLAAAFFAFSTMVLVSSPYSSSRGYGLPERPN